MSVDWDGLVHGPIMATFAEPTPIAYTIAGGSPMSVDGVFDAGARPVTLVGEPEISEVRPILGVRLAQFPAGWNPRNAKGDTFVARGRAYVVREGKPDSHGWALLEANAQ